MRFLPVLILAGAALAGVSCSKSKPQGPVAAPAAKGALQGTVLEAIPAPPYVYLRVKAVQGEVWAAVPAADLKPGAPVTIQVQMRMDHFESPSLHRTFDALYMGTLAGAADVKVEKASGANARTVAELYAHRSEIKDHSVTVKGRVVKCNEGIMGRNWLHLRDGSGSEGAKDGDITVTTKDAAKVGDVLTVTGTVHLDRDFGSGYAYPVIIEDARIQK